MTHQTTLQSNELRIYTELCNAYPNDIVPITSISRNISAGRDFIISAHLALNYDKVMNCAPCYSFTSDEKSPDSIFIHNDTLYFVEFKDGQKPDKTDVRGKIHEGINTLFHFAKSRISLKRKEFLSLNIIYVVFRRRNSNRFLDAIQTASYGFNLQNLEGLLVKKTAVSDDPQYVADFFHRITSGVVTQIEIFDHNGSGNITAFQGTPSRGPHPRETSSDISSDTSSSDSASSDASSPVIGNPDAANDGSDDHGAINSLPPTASDDRA